MIIMINYKDLSVMKIGQNSEKGRGKLIRYAVTQYLEKLDMYKENKAKINTRHTITKCTGWNDKIVVLKKSDLFISQNLREFKAYHSLV